MKTLIPHASVEIDDLKTRIEAIVASADQPVTILQDREPVGLFVPLKLWDALCEVLEDIELRRIVEARQGEPVIAVKLGDL